MKSELEKAQDVLLEKVNNICGKFGLNNIMAELYIILYTANETLSLSEMAERLKISKGSVSINIRALESYGAVKRVWVKGSRKDYYEAERNISKVIVERVKSMAEKRLFDLDDMLNSSYRALDSIKFKNEEEKAGIESFRQKLDELKKLYSKASLLFGLFKSDSLNGILKQDNPAV